MSYLGDFRLGDTFDTKFTTVSTTGAPTTLAGSPVISAYVGNSTTELTAGITLTVDFDARTGMHNVRVVATSGNGYATASDYQLVITTGTVGGTSVVGYVVSDFSIEHRSALMPTTAARTLDVTATGEGGVDWGNVGSPTAQNALDGTTIKTATDVEADTQDIQARLPAALTANGNIKADTLRVSGTVQTAGDLSAQIDAVDNFVDTEVGDIQGRLPAALVAGRIDASVGAMAAAVVTAAAVATGAIDADALAADAVDEIWDEVMEGTVTARQSLRAANSANASKLSGGGTATETIRDISDTKDRIVATVDANGNRTAITLDLA